MILRLALMVATVFAFQSELQAQSFLKDILTKSPGPLSNPHKEYDDIQGCISCHSNRLGGDIANPKCMDCHLDIKERVEANRGYHAGKLECHTCHVEHKGRNAFIFAPTRDWQKTFNHSEAGYELLGKHKAVECRDCHTNFRVNAKTKLKTTTESYLDAPTQCYDCHQKDYEHSFSKKEWLECTQCHSSNIENWKKMARTITFDHSETRYPLEGLHQKVGCTECHQPAADKKRVTTFAPLAFAQCTDCHEDVHKGAFGPNCTTCHSVYKDWKDVAPVKDAKTGRDLKGFDHGKTRFPLKGYHEAVKCEACHSNPEDNFKYKDGGFDECSDCHSFAHGVQFSQQQCTDCHTMERRFGDSTFDWERHSKTDFPLTGRHQVIDCNKCHYSGQYEEIAFARCDDCHRNPHDGRQIEQECSFCHVTTSFSWIQFDHNKHTDFRLTGEHRDVACVSCHVDQIFKDMPANNAQPNCQGCHADPHGESMPNECSTCHVTEGFKLVRNFDHQKEFGFALDGRHAELSCQKCHSEHLLGNYEIPLHTPSMSPQACANCHVDVHEGAYGPNCQSCHSVNSFTVSYGAQVHDLGFFQLKGAHTELACNDCHRQDTNLQGVGVMCAWCHESDDIHSGRMGPECQDCHQQTAWLPTTFKHNTTGFRLTGAHRHVECSSCHVNQIYSGLPTDCYFCHSDSYLSTGLVPAHSGGIAECSDCHSSMSWTIRRGGGLQ
jgi:hypothetical protein